MIKYYKTQDGCCKLNYNCDLDCLEQFFKGQPSENKGNLHIQGGFFTGSAPKSVEDGKIPAKKVKV